LNNFFLFFSLHFAKEAGFFIHRGDGMDQLRRACVCSLMVMGTVAFTLELAFYTSHKAWWPRSVELTLFDEQVLWSWSWYTCFDPVFELPPLWLRVMCWIEVVVFGPLYWISAFALANRRPWARSVVLPFAGALLYSTIVYFALELGSEIVPGTNALVVLLVNAPWTVLPVLLIALVW
jgi:hypothetical protein